MNLELMKKKMLAKAEAKRESRQLQAGAAGSNKPAPLDQDRVLVALEFAIMIQTFEKDLQLAEEGSTEYDVIKGALGDAWSNLKANAPKYSAEHAHFYYTIFQTYEPKQWFDLKTQEAYDARITFLSNWYDSLSEEIERREAAAYAAEPAEHDGDNREPDVMDNLHRMRAREDVNNTGLTWDGYEDEISERTSEVASMFSALVVPDIVNF